ncbi:CBO0543 family protein [Litchfieldia alkalitelluris]|uniref:CBO0543 family protein n=1 Tax=Litchfieldia alkalitelluris TaxID=304268 RepID=UPI000997196B|nr:CBO0543 family protein [Litchfieldia alkalitelluris]
MINAIYASIWLFSLYKWGDWKNWKNYYSTILFFILGDFIYLYLLSDIYPMWKYEPYHIDGTMGITNTHVSLSIMAIKYPATVLIYLYHFPENNWKKQFGYLLLWVGLYSINEIIDLYYGVINYYNGWNFWWSIIMNIIIFSTLRIHYHNPILAWLMSIAFILCLWHIFNVPSTVFR